MSDSPHVLFRGKFLELAAIGHWEFVRRTKNATPVGIVAMTDATASHPGEVILISQFRIPVNKICVEIPAGLVGDGDHTAESWKSAALRELLEETGYAADDVLLLSDGPTSAGLTSECIKLVRAVNVRKFGPPQPDGDEQIQVHPIPLPDVSQFLRRQIALGHLIDPKVYAALYFLTQPAALHP